MIDWKKLGKKLLFLPIWLLPILSVVCAVALILVFVKGLETHPVSYAVYVLSFYTLSVLCIFFWKVLPSRYRAVKEKLYATKYGNRYFTDPAFRTHVSLYASLGINLLYVGMNVLFGIHFRSAWFSILAGYYAILAVMRFLLVRYVGKIRIGSHLLGEWQRSRACAIILTLVNLSLSGAILMILYQDRGFYYYGMLIYVMAAYTFYMTTHAILDIIKYRKYKSPVLSTAKIVSLASALVSMLSLETAMLTTFGAETSADTKWILVAATGAGISVVVLAMSGYMIVRSTKEIATIKKENHL